MKRLDTTSIASLEKRAGSAQSGPTPPPIAPPALDYPEALKRFIDSVEAQTRHSPHLEAFAALKDAGDHPDAVLSLRAADIWNEVVRSNPSEPIALHHLAIIHHGTGYRLHLNGPETWEAAVEHWRRGLQAWARMIRDDAFWTRLRSTWEDAAGDLMASHLLKVDLAAFRAQMPRYLLGLHAGIVTDLHQSNPATARQQMELIVGSEFEPQAVAAIRDDLYARLVKDVDGLRDRHEFAEALRRVETYRAFDPDHVPALADAVKVCAAEGSHIRIAAKDLNRAEKAIARARPWAEHRALVEAARRPSEAAMALRDYYFAWAELERDLSNQAFSRDDIAGSLRHCEKVRSHARRAVEFEHGGNKAKLLFLWACKQGAVTAIDTKDAVTAKKFLDAGMAFESDDTLINTLLAAYHYQQGRFDEFRVQLSKAEALHARAPDQNAATRLANLRVFATQSPAELKANQLLDEAFESFNRGDLRAALRHLERAQTFKDDLFMLHFLKTAIYRREGNIVAARTAYRRARQLNVPPDFQEHMDALRNEYG